MRALEHRIPPPLVALACAAGMWGMAGVTSPLGLSSTVRAVSAAVLSLAGAFFCLAGVVSFRRARTTVNPLKPQSASSLVNSGIYRVSRNPMYVGFALLLAAWAAWLASPPGLLGVVLFVLYVTRFQIVPEERALAALFGAEFERYRQGVRRWL